MAVSDTKSSGIPVGDPDTKTAVEESNIRDMIHFMNAGVAAEALILSSDGVAPSGSATPFCRLDAVSTLVPSCSQPRLSVTALQKLLAYLLLSP